MKEAATMVSVEIDLTTVHDWEDFHDAFARALGFPDFYGRNTNAWEDMLSDLSKPGVVGMTTVEVPAGEDLVLRLNGAAAFAEADKFKGAEIDFAGDAVTMPEAAAAMTELLGKTISYQPIPIAAVRQNSEDFALMLEWFDTVGYNADIPSLESRWGIKPITLKQWKFFYF